MSKNIFRLRITYTDAGNRREGMPYRIIEFRKEASLQHLADVVLKNFNFKMSEPFGFYSDLENWHRSEFRYELFEDDPKKYTIKNTSIEELFEQEKTYLFIYDYLEEYRFLLDFEKDVPERGIITYPELIESMGEAPAKSERDHTFDDLGDDDDYSPKGGGKKGSGFTSEDDFDSDSGYGKGGGLNDDDPFAEDDEAEKDEYGFDEFNNGGYDDDDYK